jgi:hypothetical protein
MKYQLTKKDIEVVKGQVEQAKQLAKQYPTELMVVATFNESEYKEFKPSSESFDKWQAMERLFMQQCREQGLFNIVLEHCDLFGFAKYLTENNLENNSATRSAYVAQKYKKQI